jgi:hypothetical protein
MRWIWLTAVMAARVAVTALPVLAALPALAAPPALAADTAASQVTVPPAHVPAVPGAPVRDAARAAPARLAFALPAAWIGEQPASTMRLAQAKIPGPAGSGEFAIFYFGAGGGGGAEANIARWIEQIEQPAAPPKRGSFSAHGLEIQWVEVAGTMKASTIGMGPTTAKPGSRLLGAVVEGPGGPWFVKAIGPDTTVAAARAAFLDLLHGLRAAAP